MLRAPSLLAAAIAGTTAATMAAAQIPGRRGTLNFAVVAETSGYDCHASQTFALLHPVTPQYSLLVRWDATENSRVTGDLAKSWTISPDGLTYTLKLHEGIKFHPHLGRHHATRITMGAARNGAGEGDWLCEGH